MRRDMKGKIKSRRLTAAVAYTREDEHAGDDTDDDDDRLVHSRQPLSHDVTVANDAPRRKYLFSLAGEGGACRGRHVAPC